MKKIVLPSLLALSSCGLSLDLIEKELPPPDYSNIDYWMAHPEKIDLSDSSFTGELVNQFDIPVFFVSPTVYFPEKKESWNLNPSIAEEKSLFETPLTFQSTAFNVAGFVFSPAYRQSAYQVYTIPPNPITTRSYDIAYSDVRNAFNNFIHQIGPQTPFILASHSQGTDHLIRLFQEDFPKALYGQLVAAYLIGMPVNDCEMPLPICEEPTSTGCYTSWRTFHTTAKVFNKYPVACIGVTNPISWNTTTVLADISLNTNVMYNENKPLLQALVSAQINNGVVITKRPKFPGSMFIRTKNYHRGDINLYYGNIQSNVKVRCLRYLKEQNDYRE
ncbi:MAG: DUF3089 domain-containing protein [Bacteroidota bacterium]|nr:DUF3089 domain-containing protein [Bacteroidota bacterium]